MNHGIMYRLVHPSDGHRDIATANSNDPQKWVNILSFLGIFALGHYMVLTHGHTGNERKMVAYPVDRGIPTVVADMQGVGSPPRYLPTHLDRHHFYTMFTSKSGR